MSGGGRPAASGPEKIKVLIVDDTAETREQIRKLLQFEADIDVVGMARTGREGIQLAKETKPNVILMDINMPDMDGIQATEVIVKEVPIAQVVMLSVQSESDYLRRAMLAGARDFLNKPPSIDELIGTIRRLGEMSRQREKMLTVAPPTESTTFAVKKGTVDGKIVTFFGPKGGVGCTTLVANTAIALQSDDVKVLVVDANLQFGDIGVFFNVRGKHSLVSLAARADELDEEFMQTVFLAHPSGVKVVLGVPTPEDAELVTAPALKRILEMARGYFHYVLVDTASVLREQELTVLDVADRIVLIAAPDIPSLANAKKFFDLSEKLEYQRAKIMLVLNKLIPRSGIQAQNVEDSLKHTVKAQIQYDDKTVLSSINSGVPFITGAKTAPPVQGITELAQKIKEEFAPKEAVAATGPIKPQPPKPKGLFDRR
jgi:pilus assembly protein CpaE